MSGYIGRGIEYGNAVADHFTGNGGATYTLSYDTVTNGVVVSLDGVVQKNGTDFNVTGTSLVFTSTVANPIAIQVIYTGLTLTYPVPSDNTVSIAKLTATGTASSSTYLRGDNTWASAGGDSIANGVIRTNAKNITANATLEGTVNGFCAGPITIDSSVTLTINSGATLTVVGA